MQELRIMLVNDEVCEEEMLDENEAMQTEEVVGEVAELSLNIVVGISNLRTIKVKGRI